MRMSHISKLLSVLVMGMEAHVANAGPLDNPPEYRPKGYAGRTSRYGGHGGTFYSRRKRKRFSLHLRRQRPGRGGTRR